MRKKSAAKPSRWFPCLVGSEMSDNGFKSKVLQSLTWDGETFMDAEGISHRSVRDYIGIELLGFCGCGCPDAAVVYVRDALAGIKAVKDSGWTEEAWRARDAQYASEGERYFVWYRLDDLGLTEHGGSVPGWLTEKGEDWLLALDEALADEREASW
jgi:hypothetical protein